MFVYNKWHILTSATEDINLHEYFITLRNNIILKERAELLDSTSTAVYVYEIMRTYVYFGLQCFIRLPKRMKAIR